eukprot:13576734-Ditylum_brightwellii.AAC.1
MADVPYRGDAFASSVESEEDDKEDGLHNDRDKDHVDEEEKEEEAVPSQGDAFASSVESEEDDLHNDRDKDHVDEEEKEEEAIPYQGD